MAKENSNNNTLLYVLLGLGAAGYFMYKKDPDFFNKMLGKKKTVTVPDGNPQMLSPKTWLLTNAEFHLINPVGVNMLDDIDSKLLYDYLMLAPTATAPTDERAGALMVKKVNELYIKVPALHPSM